MAGEIDYQDYQMAVQFDRRALRLGALEPLVDALIGELRLASGHRVLDVGTGTGRLALMLFDRLPAGSVVGVDSGRGMLRLAREKALDRGADNYLLVRGQAEALPFLPGVFNSACMMMSFHHFSSPGQAAAEACRVLRPGGLLASIDPVLVEFADSEGQRMNEAIEEAFQEAHGPGFRFFTAARLQELYEGAGFRVEACRVSEVSFDRTGIEGIPMGPHWNQVRENLWFRREKELLQRFEQEYFRFRMQGRLVAITGRAWWALIRAVKR